MSEDLNSVFVVGRIVKDAELQYTNTGFAICKMSIASNKRKKEGDQWVDKANFFDITLWGKRGESLAQYLVKGQQVAISGSLNQDTWEQDGAKRSKVGIEANNIQLLGSKKDSGNYQEPQGTPIQPQQKERFDGSDIPF